MYKIFDNEDGKRTLREIRETKKRIRELLMPDFWSIEGRNSKTNNPGYVVLQKLAIADYLNKTYRLVRVGGQIWRYDWRKGYYVYDVDNSLLHHEIRDIIDMVGNRDEGYTYNGNSISDTLDIIHSASFGNKVFIDTESPFNKQIALDKHTELINAKNGVLKIDYVNRNVTLLGKMPQYMFNYCINTIYKEEIKNDVIHEMLLEILGGEQTDLIYQIAAMAIRDTNPKLIPSKIAYLFIGKKHTGKNTVMDILRKFFGNAIVSHITLNDIAKNKYIKPLLEGKVINLDDELPEQLQFTESREIKSLTGGKFHYIEPKFGNPYTAIITALMVFAGNQFPRCSISKNASAFWGRWEVIHFDHPEFPVDEKRTKRLLTPENMSGFFYRVIQKLFEIHDNGIVRRNNAFKTYDEWQGSSNSVFQFIQDMTVPVEERIDYTKEEFFRYYNEWCDWLEIPMENRCPSINQFDKELINTWKVKENNFGTTENGIKKRHPLYRMFREYDRNLFISPDNSFIPPEDGDGDDINIPDCGFYPRKR